MLYSGYLVEYFNVGGYWYKYSGEYEKYFYVDWYICGKYMVSLNYKW